MSLYEFMERLGVSDEEVAQAIGRDRSTISRIRREKVVPDSQTLLKLNRWAVGAASRKRLRVAERLTWDHLIDEGATAA